jgi:ATP-binding cassette subfamily B protein
VLLLIPFVLAPIFVFGKQVRKLTAASQDRFAEAIGQAGETLDALETVQAFGREASAPGASPPRWTWPSPPP